MFFNSHNNVNNIISEAIAAHKPDRIAFCFNDRAYSYKELSDNVAIVMSHLIAAGVRKGTIVGYSLPNCAEILFLIPALSRIGACMVPLFHMIPDMGKTGIFTRSNVEIVITSARLFNGLNDAVKKSGASFKIASIDKCDGAYYSFANSSISEIVPSEFTLKETPGDLPFFIASSSGTTGIPKPILMSQSNVAANMKASYQLAMPLDIYGKEYYSSAIAFPLSTAGVMVIYAYMLAGVTIVFTDDISPVSFMELIAKWKCEAMTAPPAYFEAILNLPPLPSFNYSTIQCVVSGMDFLSPSLLSRLKLKFPRIRAANNGYGLMETSTVFMIWKGLSDNELNGATSRLSLVEGIGNEIDVRDETGRSVIAGENGELYIKGKSVISGYPENEIETKNSFFDGWFKTGDFARKESETTITLLGRNKYLIKRGGKTISPVVIQNHLNTCHGVVNSAVVGVPHQLYGEMVWAFIIKSPDLVVTLKDIMKHCRTELPAYMVPDQIVFVNDIPKNPGVGKLDYEKMKQMAMDELNKMEVIQNG